MKLKKRDVLGALAITGFVMMCIITATSGCTYVTVERPTVGDIRLDPVFKGWAATDLETPVDAPDHEDLLVLPVDRQMMFDDMSIEEVEQEMRL